MQYTSMTDGQDTSRQLVPRLRIASRGKDWEAAHHKWLCRIRGDTCRDKILNEDIRHRTGMEELQVILRKIRLQ